MPLNGGISSAGMPYGGQLVNGKFVPHSVGELRREVDPTGKMDVLQILFCRRPEPIAKLSGIDYLLFNPRVSRMN